MKLKIIALMFLFFAQISYGQTPASDGEQEAGSQAELTNLSAAPEEMASVRIAVAYEEFPQVKSAMMAVEATQKSCLSSFKTARYACIAPLSDKVQAGAAAVGLIMGTINMTSLVEACSSFQKAMNIAQTALTLYNSACTAGQAYCSGQCATFQQKITAAEGAVTTALGQCSTKAAYAAKCATDLGEIQKSLGSYKLKATPVVARCEKFKLNLAAAGMGLMGIVNQKGMADQCKKATTTVDCNDPVNALNESCKKTIDCNKTENAQNATCICNKAPNTAGCPGALAGSGTGYSGSGSVGSDTGSLGSNNNFGAGPDFQGAGADAMPVVSPTGGAGASDGSAGGSGGAGLAGGGAGGADGQADKKAGNKLNTNIIGGYEGGGGGGGARGAASASSAYGSYMPGAANDPSKNASAQTFANGQVTGAGSKSNWQKVRERYGDNKSSLMGW